MITDVPRTAPDNDTAESRWARRVLLFLRRGWFLTLALALVGAAAGWAYALQRTDHYTAHATVYVTLDTSRSGTDLNQGAAFIQSQMPSYAELVDTQLVMQPVVEQLRLEEGVAGLRSNVEVTNPQGTAILILSVEDASPERAVVLANELAEHLTTAIADTSAEEGDGVQGLTVKVVEEASPATVESEERTSELVLTGAVGGAVAGLLLLLLAAVLDRRVRGPEDLDVLPGIPVLDGGRGPAGSSDPEPSADLTTLVQCLAVAEQPPLSWAVLAGGTEADPRSTASAVAAALGQLGTDVLVLDATASTGAPPRSPGAQPPSTAVLEPLMELATEHSRPSAGRGRTGDTAEATAVRATVLRLSQLTELGWDPRRNDHVDELLRFLGDRATTLVLAVGPLGASPWSATLTARADAVVLCVQRGRTLLSELRRAVGNLRAGGVNVVATVLGR